MQRTKSLAALVLLVLCASAHAQAPDRSRSNESAAGRPDFSGTWERYAPPRDPNAPPPRGTPGGAGIGLGPIFGAPPPPLKSQFVAAYEAEVKRIADATQRGDPIANANAQCIPDGMPSMMLAIFPM